MVGRRRSTGAGRRGARGGAADGRPGVPGGQTGAGEGSARRRGSGGGAGATRGRAESAADGTRQQEAADDHDPRQRARDICLRLLAVRPRTRSELAAALRQRSVPGDVADSVLERYSEVGMIDDAAFAEAWVSSRHRGRGLARRALAYELRRKGVDNPTVSQALDQLDPDTERETAEALVRRRLRALSGAAPDAAFRKLVGMLARKGYPQGLSVRVVRDALAEAAAEADLDLDTLVDAADAEASADAESGWRRGGVRAAKGDDLTFGSRGVTSSHPETQVETE